MDVIRELGGLFGRVRAGVAWRQSAFFSAANEGRMMTADLLNLIVPATIALISIATFFLVHPAQRLSFVPVMVVAFVCYLLTSYREMPKVERVLPTYLIALAIQFLHFAEEYVYGFHQRIAEVMAGMPPFGVNVFVAFNMIAYSLFLLAGLGMYKGMKFPMIIVWFFAVVVPCNAIWHALLTLRVGGYFPGLYTSLAGWIVGPILLKRLWEGGVGKCAPPANSGLRPTDDTLALRLIDLAGRRVVPGLRALPLPPSVGWGRAGERGLLMTRLIESIFAVAPEIRYVATYLDGVLASAQRPGIGGASGSESDKYEELIVNPTLLKLVTQRGDIDCGGAHWVLIRYGNFYEIVIPVAAGHLSVGLEPTANPLPVVESVVRAYATSPL